MKPVWFQTVLQYARQLCIQLPMETSAQAIQILRNAFTQRHERNPRYSMRAFAKSIGVSHTVLSLVLSGKRPLSKKAAVIIAERLALDPAKSLELRATTKKKAASPKTARDYQMIEMDLFHLISDWVHYAILSLVEIETKLLNPKRIAKVLQITEAHAKLTFERLIENDLIHKVN